MMADVVLTVQPARIAPPLTTTTATNAIVNSSTVDHSTAVHSPHQQQHRQHECTASINDRSLTNAMPIIISETVPTHTTTALDNGQLPAAEAQQPQTTFNANQHRCAAGSIEEKWYSLPLRWRTHPSATVERQRKPVKTKTQRHSWHAHSDTTFEASSSEASLSMVVAEGEQQENAA